LRIPPPARALAPLRLRGRAPRSAPRRRGRARGPRPAGLVQVAGDRWWRHHRRREGAGGGIFLAIAYFDHFFLVVCVQRTAMPWVARLLSVACVSVAAKMEYCAPALPELDAGDSYKFCSCCQPSAGAWPPLRPSITSLLLFPA
uniref:Uncharacterized protein n=1 Tax=Aegilops tauschii subsp. strangulata TaxID=200361 RepID=A0A453A0A5_AEGTS